ncbi:MAG: thioredoxin family protein [Bacteroidetes bacterium]|nr:thioredoxin family protein [Bacteroidota bacterium]
MLETNFLVIGSGVAGLTFAVKIAEAVPGINLKTILRDENTALMNAFLTNGTQSIPKLIIVD